MSNTIVKALSIMQPWVDAHLYLGKPVENRSWRPSHAQIGQRIALHASAKVDKDGMAFIRTLPAPIPQAAALLEPKLSAILGTAVLAGYVVMKEESIKDGFGNEIVTRSWMGWGNVGDYDPLTDPWFFGPVGFVWRDVQELVTPITCNGALGFWNIPPDIQAMLATAETRPANVLNLKVQYAQA
ncbi:MAG: hypothetical protein OT477_12975 [Chloroflexi bacterium]|nr:hypothetical protein [Chloroflexota bacterium]